ncbi:MAG: peptidoglycan-binding protein [Oculatellaceae cyanobacterium Prado106]|jgi:peptidoglycan hydrolase-like protein with peptidoglycan-binding domain|nr:peptidoglycan-binding protein [Oculatellaceae cyanobacterium Prado106]
MFPYKDPTGTDFLQQQGALDTYRGRLISRYDTASKVANTHFAPIASMHNLKSGKDPDVATVTWTAFPRRNESVSNDQVDRVRTNQEEYVEWAVQSSGGKLSSITFTTEFSAYFQTLADHSFNALVAGVKAVIPTANPTVRELLGVDQVPAPLTADGVVGPATWKMLEMVLDRPVPDNAPTLRQGSRGEPVVWLQIRLRWLNLLDGSLDGSFGAKTHAAVVAAQKRYLGAGELFRRNLSNNPWNNGQKGILCMANFSNTLPLLFGLMANCSTPRPNVRPQEVCNLVGSINCVPGRSSDPFVCVAAQTQALSGNALSLRDPVGIEFRALQGIWRINGQQIDINNPQQNQGIWQLSRGRHRAVLKNVPGLTLDGAPIISGAQVARKLQVGADVVVASKGDVPS